MTSEYIDIEQYIDIEEYIDMAKDDIKESILQYNQKNYRYAVMFLQHSFEKVAKVYASYIGQNVKTDGELFTAEYLATKVQHDPIKIFKKIGNVQFEKLTIVRDIIKNNPWIEEEFKKTEIFKDFDIEKELNSIQKLIHAKIPILENHYQMNSSEIKKELLDINSIETINYVLKMLEHCDEDYKDFKDNPNILSEDSKKEKLWKKMRKASIQDLKSFYYCSSEEISQANYYIEKLFKLSCDISIKLVELLVINFYISRYIIYISIIISPHAIIPRYFKEIYSKDLPIVEKLDDLFIVHNKLLFDILPELFMVQDEFAKIFVDMNKIYEKMKTQEKASEMSIF